jgi:Protein of unknown function DUF115
VLPIFYDTTWVPRLRYAWRQFRNPSVTNASRKYWLEMRRKYEGRRGFVIGNGPSLKISDLQAISSEVSIAANRIYLAYSETTWRPVVHTCCDPLVWQKYSKEMCENADKVIINARLNPHFGDLQKVLVYRNLGPCTQRGGMTSSDACIGLYSGWTVTCENIQIAVHLGLDPIYLLGCDHFYRGETGLELVSNTKQVVEHVSGTSNHFHPNYRTPGEKVYAAPIERMEAAYTALRDWGNRIGVKIFNATRGGHLEIFPRVDFDSLR